jgi:hypothetical protein
MARIIASIIQHDLGIKWRLYVKTLVLELCHDVLRLPTDVMIEDKLISLMFREISLTCFVMAFSKNILIIILTKKIL